MAEPNQRQLEYRAAPEGMLRVYANNISMASTRFDLRIYFGEVAELTEEKAVIENRVQVTVTWHEAKLLADFLQANLKAFEELNGPLTLPNIPTQMIVPQTFAEPK